ncbi:copper/zinc superoxide dismutase [Ancylostoma caninum]|uniref:Copper/zinc superoxide dismutase n=1 Tax=Ancylostoma caninum TaxID=29170 RepID=A0A368FZW2_ANCCA|nr:copper/zinc superoxide dismutase [Ancylostoma caninum]
MWKSSRQNQEKTPAEAWGGSISHKLEVCSWSIRGTLSGLKQGAHGLNIHEEAKLGDNCNAAGAPLNPNINLGDIRTSVTGATMVRVTSREISLEDIVGRAIVINGNAADEGTRVACGVIRAS